MSITRRNTLAGLCWAGLAITVWSGSLIMLRLGVTTSLNAYDLTLLRFGVAGLILSPVVLLRGTGTDRLQLTGVVAMVIAFGAPYVLLISLALETAPAAAAGALNPGVMAIGAVLLGRMILGDRIGRARFSGLAVTAMGVLLFTRAGGIVTIGHLILIGTGIMWASYVLIVRRAAVPALNAAAIVAVGSAVFYMPVYLVALPKRIAEAPLVDVVIQAGFQGILVSVFAIYAFNRSAELLGPVAGATLPALIPVVTLGLGVAVLGETADPAEIASAILVTVGLVLVLAGARAMRWLFDQLMHGPTKKPRP
ncbi:DMT family transporter [uncultured Roseobacter sp.]|uniref:DMT family transporter n=1 Tax=uncultured Roseobacter sp. TaxID=114847 RepID=UPI00261B5EC9|nr:DMT family transporter [uncultured Roseobacter sp.]